MKKPPKVQPGKKTPKPSRIDDVEILESNVEYEKLLNYPKSTPNKTPTRNERSEWPASPVHIIPQDLSEPFESVSKKIAKDFPSILKSVPQKEIDLGDSERDYEPSNKITTAEKSYRQGAESIRSEGVSPYQTRKPQQQTNLPQSKTPRPQGTEAPIQERAKSPINYQKDGTRSRHISIVSSETEEKESDPSTEKMYSADLEELSSGGETPVPEKNPPQFKDFETLENLDSKIHYRKDTSKNVPEQRSFQKKKGQPKKSPSKQREDSFNSRQQTTNPPQEYQQVYQTPPPQQVHTPIPQYHPYTPPPLIQQPYIPVQQPYPQYTQPQYPVYTQSYAYPPTTQYPPTYYPYNNFVGPIPQPQYPQYNPIPVPVNYQYVPYYPTPVEHPQQYYPNPNPQVPDQYYSNSQIPRPETSIPTRRSPEKRKESQLVQHDDIAEVKNYIKQQEEFLKKLDKEKANKITSPKDGFSLNTTVHSVKSPQSTYNPLDSRKGSAFQPKIHEFSIAEPPQSQSMFIRGVEAEKSSQEQSENESQTSSGNILEEFNDEKAGYRSTPSVEEQPNSVSHQGQDKNKPEPTKLSKWENKAPGNKPSLSVANKVEVSGFNVKKVISISQLLIFKEKDSPIKITQSQNPSPTKLGINNSIKSSGNAPTNKEETNIKFETFGNRRASDISPINNISPMNVSAKGVKLEFNFEPEHNSTRYKIFFKF